MSGRGTGKSGLVKRASLPDHRGDKTRYNILTIESIHMPRYTIAGFNMPQLSILAGGMMSSLGVGFFVATEYITALFPLLFGVILVGSGGLSIARPATNALTMHIAFLFSSISVILGLTTALTGSWVTTTSLIEQVLMSAIGGFHVIAGYGAYAYGKASTESESQVCGKTDSEISDTSVRSVIRGIGTPDERIVPAASFMLVTD